MDFLISILTLQFIFYITILFNIPIVKQVIGFFYLTFIPGLVFLRLLRLKKFDTTETILFSVGLSVAFLMLTGLFINELCPVFDITQPLSSALLLITQSTIILVEIILSYILNMEASKETKRNSHHLPFNKQTILIFAFSLITIILGIFGVLTLNITKDSHIFLFLILVISILFLLGAFFGRKNQILHPLILFTICLSALFFIFGDTSIVTEYIIGKGDQWIEYQAFKFTEISFFWNSAMSPSAYAHVLFPTYSMISVTILPTIFSQILQLDSSWTFKILYPFIVSFMALGTYKLYTTQTNSKVAFLASFFFITISTGKGWGSAKQMAAQLFYVLLLLLFFNKKITPMKRKILFVIFSFALVASHYALSYIFIFIMLFFFLTLTFMKYYKSGMLFTNESRTLLSLTMIYLVIAFSWGIYVNASEAFNLLLDSINTVIRNINEFFNPQSRGTALKGLGVVETPTIFHRISTFLFLLTEFFIVVGFLKLVVKSKQGSFDQNYKIISAANLTIIMMNLLLPKLADTFLMSRFYQTTLIVLAPLSILGGQTIIEHLPKINLKKFSATVLAVFVLVPLFLFQTGFIYEVAGVRCESLPLSMHRWDDLKLHGFITEPEEVIGATWLFRNANTSGIFVYSDITSKFHVLTAYSLIERGRIFLLSNRTKSSLGDNEFIYLGYTSVINKKVATHLPDIGYYRLNITEVSNILESQNKLYSNGECEIYKGLNMPGH